VPDGIDVFHVLNVTRGADASEWSGDGRGGSWTVVLESNSSRTLFLQALFRVRHFELEVVLALTSLTTES